MIEPQGTLKSIHLESTRPNHDHFGSFYHFLEIVAKQGADVGDLILDVLTIGSDQAPESDVAVPNQNLTTFT